MNNKEQDVPDLDGLIINAISESQSSPGAKAVREMRNLDNQIFDGELNGLRNNYYFNSYSEDSSNALMIELFGN